MDDASPPVEIIAPLDDDSSRIEIPKFLPSGPRCPEARADEIVVCRTNPESFRLRPLPEKYEDKFAPRPRVELNESTSVDAELESAGVGGFPSNRVMLRAKIKF